jgi:methylglyoxal synthase
MHNGALAFFTFWMFQVSQVGDISPFERIAQTYGVPVAFTTAIFLFIWRSNKSRETMETAYRTALIGLIAEQNEYVKELVKQGNRCGFISGPVNTKQGE